MKLEQQVVSLELSKQLKEAGYPQEGLFWWGIPQNSYPNHTFAIVEYRYISQRHWDGKKPIVAPTVAELGERLKGKTSMPYYLRGKWVYNNDNANLPITIHISEDTEAGARAKMYLYLKKENLLALQGKVK